MITSEEIIIDAENEILGRVAAFSAKKALQGHKVAILNCSHALISGNRQNIIGNYLQLRKRPNVKFPSRAEQIMKRAVRGMINYKSGRGAEAFKGIRCYDSVPENYKNSKAIKLGNKNKDLMNVSELSKMLK